MKSLFVTLVVVASIDFSLQSFAPKRASTSAHQPLSPSSSYRQSSVPVHSPPPSSSYAAPPQPKRQCKQVPKTDCKQVPRTSQETVYEEECSTSYEQECNTRYE